MIKVQEAIKLMGSHLNMLSMESGMTLPIPTIEDTHLMLRRFVYTKRLVAGEGTYLTPPEMVACVDMTRGEFVSVVSVEPNAFAGPDDQSLLEDGAKPAKFDEPRFDSPEELLATYRRLYELYDLLLPGFVARGRPETAPAEEVEAAKEFHTLFQRLREPPLDEFYRKQGADFFTRIDKLRQASSR